jgi:hypothetical protein
LENTELINREIEKLVDEMETAVIADHESNKNHKPAFLRFKLLHKIENTLRKP